MKIKAQSPLLNGWEGTATITTESGASSYGRAVLVIEGEPIGTQDAWIASAPGGRGDTEGEGIAEA